MVSPAQPPTDLGSPIPANVKHAISVTLPTWASNVGYEEGQDWVVNRMQCGYPRFFIGKNIQRLAERCITRFGQPGEAGMLFPSVRCAQRCREFLIAKSPLARETRIVEVHDISRASTTEAGGFLCVVLYTASLSPIAKQYWQHTGEGISSRLADYFLLQSEASATLSGSSEENGDIHVEFTKKNQNHNRHYSRKPSIEKPIDRHNSSAAAGDAETLNRDQLAYVEERYGRNLSAHSVHQAKLAVRRRIAGNLTVENDLDMPCAEGSVDAVVSHGEHDRVNVEDVYLYPTGMTSIFQAHQLAMTALEEGHLRKSSCFGFPYTDTLKILEKWGPGAIFFGRGDQEDLDALEAMLASGERVLALFCECPSNPLLRTPPLQQLRRLADKYGFLIVIDETIGNLININICQYADIIVSSLTKVFSGDSNVMGGSLILNAKAPFYATLKASLDDTYEDNFWSEDAITLERNSRDFVPRIGRINANAEFLCDLILQNTHITELFYPKYGATRANYEQIKTKDGGYGGLLSVVFETVKEASVFYDALETAKGPSLGTNFTLASPYTLLAHFTELEWASQFGVSTALVRISVGLETLDTLERVFRKALSALDDFHHSSSKEEEKEET